MEPFEGGPGEPSQAEHEAQNDDVITHEEFLNSFGCGLALFVAAVVFVALGGLEILGLSYRTLAFWALTSCPLMILAGIMVRKLYRAQRTHFEKRMTSGGATLMMLGIVGLSLLAAVVSFYLCSAVQFHIPQPAPNTRMQTP